MRSKEEIQRQVEGIKAQKSNIPEYSVFGTPNWGIFDAQIAVLQGDSDVEDFPEGDWESMDEENEIYRGAEEAQDWLDNDNADDLFE